MVIRYLDGNLNIVGVERLNDSSFDTMKKLNACNFELLYDDKTLLICYKKHEICHDLFYKFQNILTFEELEKVENFAKSIGIFECDVLKVAGKLNHIESGANDFLVLSNEVASEITPLDKNVIVYDNLEQLRLIFDLINKDLIYKSIGTDFSNEIKRRVLKI